MIRLISIICAVFLLSACKPKADGESEKRSAEFDAKIASESQLVKDPDKAIPELESRLRGALRPNDGILIIKDFFDQFAVPVNTPWVLQCGLTGMTITFGGWIEKSEGEEALNRVMIHLVSLAPIESDACDVLTPIIAKDIEKILNGG